MVHLAHNMDYPNEGVEKLLLSIQLLWSTIFFRTHTSGCGSVGKVTCSTMP